MEENIKLIKEFRHTPQIMRQGIRAYQQKFVYPKAIVKSIVFLLISFGIVAVILSGALNEKIKFVGYLAFVAFFALIFRELFNPLKQRDNIVQSMNGNGIIPLYRLTVKEKSVEISTVEEVFEDESDEEEFDEAYEDDYSEEAAKPTVIPIDGSLSVLEKEDCFVLVCSDYVYYIIPKADFSPEELEIIRNIGK